MTAGTEDDESLRRDLSFTLAIGSLILFTGILPALFSCVRTDLPKWLILLLAVVPAQAANLLSCLLPARRCCPGKSIRRVLDLKIPRKSELSIIVCGTAGIYFILAIVTGVTVLILRKTGIPTPEQAAVEILRNGSPLQIAILIPAAVILAPVGEEFCFRHAIFKKLEFHLGTIPATWLSAFIFSAAHLNLQVFPALFLLGIWLAWLYRRTNSLPASMIAHSLFNTMTILLIYLPIPGRG